MRYHSYIVSPESPHYANTGGLRDMSADSRFRNYARLFLLEEIATFGDKDHPRHENYSVELPKPHIVPVLDTIDLYAYLRGHRPLNLVSITKLSTLTREESQQDFQNAILKDAIATIHFLQRDSEGWWDQTALGWYFFPDSEWEPHYNKMRTQRKI